MVTDLNLHKFAVSMGCTINGCNGPPLRALSIEKEFRENTKTNDKTPS